MPLLNSGAQAPAVEGNKVAAAVEGNKVAAAVKSADEKKAAKLEAAKRHAEKVANQKKEFYANALAFRDELIKQDVYEKLSQKSKDFVIAACRDPGESTQPASGTQLFVTLFGIGAKIGDEITLLDAFRKVQIAKGAFEKKFKEWETKGDKPAKIEVVPNATDVMATKYKIVSIAL
jgi:hypothetical protein